MTTQNKLGNQSCLAINADRRRLTSLWQQHVADIERWRRTFRPRLHTGHFFWQLVGDPFYQPVCCYSQAIAVAIALATAGGPTGHKELSMTQRYMRLSPAALDGAIRLLDQPRCERLRGDM